MPEPKTMLLPGTPYFTKIWDLQSKTEGDIEAAQPPSPSCSALPFPLPLPCRSLVYLQAFALEAAVG